MELTPFLTNSKSFYVITTDLEGRILSFNDLFDINFKDLFEELIGLPFAAILQKSEIGKFYDALEACNRPNGQINLTLNTLPAIDNRLCTSKWEFSVVNDKKTKSKKIMGVGYPIDHNTGSTSVLTGSEHILKGQNSDHFSNFLINNLPGIFLLMDENGKYKLWNQDTEKVTGYDHLEIKSMEPYAMLDPNDRTILQEAMTNALGSGNAEVEIELITKNSLRIPHYLILRPIKSEEKLFFIITGLDISEEIKTLLQMQLSESTFRSAFEYSAFGMSLVSPEGKWLKVNNELCSLLGYDEETILTLNILEITKAEDRDKIREIMQEFFDRKLETARLENRFVHKKGRTVWANISVSLIRDRMHMPLYFVIQIEDITDRKEYEEKINNQITLLSEISFITSHELRHEYAKLHSVVNFLKDRQDLFTEREDQFLIKESIRAFNNINSSIYKINDKITFGQFMEINIGGSGKMDHDHVLLVDDDPIANYVNTKLLEKYFDKNKIYSVNSSDQAIQHMKNHNSKNDYLVLLDLNMPNKTGWDFLEEYKALGFSAPVLILTSSISMSDREEAKKYDVIKRFISKPLTDEAAMQIKNMK